MKKLIKITALTPIALTTIGVVVKAIRKKDRIPKIRIGDHLLSKGKGFTTIFEWSPIE